MITHCHRRQMDFLLSYTVYMCFCVYLQQLMSQQKDGNVEERQKLTAEKEAQQRRITQLIEEIAKLKAELARCSDD